MKNILKKSIAIFMSACMLMSVTSASVIFTSAAEIESSEVSANIIKSGDYRYILLDDGTIEFCRPANISNANEGYYGFVNEDVKKYEVPAQIDGYTVTKIASSTFSNWLVLEEVILPDTVTAIESNAFYNCIALRTVDIPQSVTKIGAAAFSDCDSLTTILLPEKLTVIEERTFERCYNLKEVILPSSLTAMKNYAFGHCESLEKIDIPESVTKIDGAFFCCSALKSIKLPNNLEYIGRSTFFLCKSLKSVAIPDSVTTIGDFAFHGCLVLTNVILPKNITEIPWGAFWNCESLKNITIPEGVTFIGQRAFFGCTKIKNFKLPKNVTQIDEYAFGYYGGGTEIKNPIKDFSISGYKSTASEKYANNHGFEFIDLGFTGVDDIYFMDENVKPEINKITDGEIYDKVLSQIGNEKLMAIYEMNFESEKEITIRVPVRVSASKLYRVESDGTLSAVDFKSMSFKSNVGGVFVLTGVKNDISNDGKVTVVDVTYLQMYLAGYSIVINISNADVNQDDKTDVADVTKLQLILAGA